MATTEAPVNGTYPHHAYGSLDSQQNNYAYGANSTTTPSQTNAAQPPPASSTPAANSTSTPQSDVPKDEVGWYFVEQYYTTLSRNPDRLYLFYNKRSQFVSGQETDKVPVCVGQRAINDRIKALDFQDCKVRVTNVDSQASDSNIVIQVIGEISNKSQPHKKFTQTFVLAAQTNGYFVLNDIFRYLIDEEEEAEAPAEPAAEQIQQAPAAESGYQEPAPTAAEVAPKGLTNSSDPAAVEHDAQQVDKEIESKVPAEQKTEDDAPKVNGVAAPEEPKEAEPAAPTPAAEEAAVEEAAPKVTEEEPVESESPEKPVEPAPTPSPPKQTPSQPPAPSKPAAPKSWASLAAAAVATPATPSTASSTSSQPKPATKPAAAQPTPATSTTPSAPSAPTAPAAQREESTNEGSDEWTAVGSTHNRNQSRQTNSQQPPPMWRGYIGNVHEGVDPRELEQHLRTFGDIYYFDVARQKQCAFIDYKTAEGYNAAIAANPHHISGVDLKFEQRRERPGQPPFIPRGQFQGRGGRGGMQGGPRPDFQQRPPRGNYSPRGARGGNGAPRGRGGSSIAT